MHRKVRSVVPRPARENESWATAASTASRRHLMIVLREYEDFCNTHRPHRA
jgi:hypothetical protein